MAACPLLSPVLLGIRQGCKAAAFLWATITCDLLKDSTVLTDQADDCHCASEFRDSQTFEQRLVYFGCSIALLASRDSQLVIVIRPPRTEQALEQTLLCPSLVRLVPENTQTWCQGFVRAHYQKSSLSWHVCQVSRL